MKRKAEQQPPTGPESRCARPVGGPSKRSRTLDQALSTAARVDIMAAATAVAAAAAAFRPALATTKKRKAEQQPPSELESRPIRPVDGPLKRRKNFDPAMVTMARAAAAAAATAAAAVAVSAPPLATTTLQQPNRHHHPEPPLFSRAEPCSGGFSYISQLLSISRSSIAADGAGVSSGGWRGHGVLPQQAGAFAADDTDGTTTGSSNAEIDKEGASTSGGGGSSSGDDVANEVDWESMYGPSGSFAGSQQPTA